MPASYPEKAMSETEVKHLAEKYMRARSESDYDTWKTLMEPMHPGDNMLFKGNFMGYGGHDIRFKIEAVVGRNVKIEWRYKAHDRTKLSWLQITSSGYIKYSAFNFEHPVSTSFSRLRSLVHENEETRARDILKLREANIPVFDFDVAGTKKSRIESVEKILNWLKEHGASHDTSEPKVFLPQEELDNLIMDAEKMISLARKRL